MNLLSFLAHPIPRDYGTIVGSIVYEGETLAIAVAADLLEEQEQGLWATARALVRLRRAAP